MLLFLNLETLINFLGIIEFDRIPTQLIRTVFEPFLFVVMLFIEKKFQKIDLITFVPTAIGFRISTPEQARDMSRYADGVIFDSAIVKICEKYGKDCVPYVYDYVKSIKDAIR